MLICTSKLIIVLLFFRYTPLLTFAGTNVWIAQAQSWTTGQKHACKTALNASLTPP